MPDMITAQVVSKTASFCGRRLGQRGQHCRTFCYGNKIPAVDTADDTLDKEYTVL